jgi:hypothetical protein
MAAYGVASTRSSPRFAPRTRTRRRAPRSEKTERLGAGAGQDPRSAEFERIIVARRGRRRQHERRSTLGQLGDVRDSQREERSIATVDGKRSISIQVRKTRGANTIDTAEAVKRNMEDLKKSLPSDIILDIGWDRSAGIKASVDNVRTTIVEGALLTVLIVFLFLHSWRSTVITGLTLPISVLAAFIALYAFGFTINFLTLLALSLSIGVLIDDAIVVRENIVRHLAMGKSHRQAALDGTNEIGPRGDGDHLHARRGLHAGRLHGRRDGALLLPVRRHGDRGGAGVALRFVHARPDAFRRSGGIRPRVGKPWGPLVGFCAVNPR